MYFIELKGFFVDDLTAKTIFVVLILLIKYHGRQKFY